MGPTFSMELPDEMLLIDAARQANASHLRLVLTRDNRVVLTPEVMPGMTPYAVQERRTA